MATPAEKQTETQLLGPGFAAHWVRGTDQTTGAVAFSRSVDSANQAKRDTLIRILKDKYGIDAAIVNNDNPAPGPNDPRELLRVTGDNAAKLAAALSIANDQKWLEGRVTDSQGEQPARNMDVSTLSDPEIQQRIDLLQKLGIQAMVDAVGPMKFIQILGANNIAALIAAIPTLAPLAPTAAPATADPASQPAPQPSPDPTFVPGDPAQPPDPANAVPNGSPHSAVFQPHHVGILARLSANYHMTQLDPNNPNAGYLFSVKNDKTIPLFTVKPYAVTLHKNSHDQDQVLRDSILVAAMMFNGNVKLENGTPELQAKIRALASDMLRAGQLVAADGRTPLTEIRFNGEVLSGPAPAAAANGAGQQIPRRAAASPTP